MKFIHLADLHFGKSIHGVSLIEEDQPYWAERFLELVDREKPQAVVIAGDAYDRSAPSDEAVALMDQFLTRLTGKGVQVLMVAGNHDSGHKLSFGSRLLKEQGLHISGVARKEMQRVQLEDEYGKVNFWLMPYVFPALISDLLEDDSIRDYDTAVRKYIGAQDIDFSGRNVMVAHQNVMAHGVEAIRGGSETMIGGVGEIDYTAFDGFAYVALGHIHAAQTVGRPEVRFAGSPMCYHFGETRQAAKGPVIVELNAPGEAPVIRTCEIPPLHPMREITGTPEQVLEEAKSTPLRDAYLRIVLRDSPVTPEIRDTLNAVFAEKKSTILEIVNDIRGLRGSDAADAAGYHEKSIPELFTAFYAARTGEESLDEKQLEVVQYLAAYAADGNHPNEPAEADIDALLHMIAEQEGLSDEAD